MTRTVGWLVLTTACGSPDAMTFATFNAGLAEGFVPGTESRTPLAADAIAAIDADVVCLQEVWTPDQVATIDDAAAAAFPHRFFPDPSQSSDALCEAGQLDTLLDCVTTSCDTTCVDDVVDCLFASCPFEFALLPRDCMRCAMANVGEDPQVVADTCTGDPVEFAYGGAFGTAVLSRHPLADPTVEVFDSTTNRRGVIHALVDAPKGQGGPVDVYCTHLTAVFDGIPYPRDEGDWQQEQLDQIEALLDLTDQGGERRVLLGDLNTGPGLDDIRPEAPEGYSLLQADGWDIPYVSLDGRCTFCADNPLLIGPDDDDNRLIDHVMVSGFEGEYAATRIIDGEVTASSCGPDLSTSAVSDHYGVSVTVQAP